MKMTIKTGDTVVVIAGKDNGKTGKVSAVYADSNRVLVDGVNIVAKHNKPKSQQDKGGIIKKEAPINASNVMIICPVCGKATRVAHSEINGKKVRVCKKCNASLDKEFVKQTKKDAKKTIKAEELKGAKLKSADAATETAPKTKKTTNSTAKKTATKTTEKKTTEKKVAEKKTAEEKPAEKKTKKSTWQKNKIEYKLYIKKKLCQRYKKNFLIKT